MAITYDPTARNTEERDPRGNFAPTTNLTIKYYPASPGPEYYICSVTVEQINSPTRLQITVSKPNGSSGANKVDVDLDDLSQVWKEFPSTVNCAEPGPLQVGRSVVLCITAKIAIKAGLSGQELGLLEKHPWGGDTVRKALKAAYQKMGDELLEIPEVADAHKMFPDLFR